VADSVGFVYIIRIIMMDASYKRHDFVGAEICCYRLLIMMNLKSEMSKKESVGEIE